MNEKSKYCEKVTCSNCAETKKLEFDFSMAFQPIINCQTSLIFGYEALVRGLNGESAYSIISKVNDPFRLHLAKTNHMVNREMLLTN